MGDCQLHRSKARELTTWGQTKLANLGTEKRGRRRPIFRTNAPDTTNSRVGLVLIETWRKQSRAGWGPGPTLPWRRRIARVPQKRCGVFTDCCILAAQGLGREIATALTSYSLDRRASPTSFLILATAAVASHPRCATPGPIREAQPEAIPQRESNRSRRPRRLPESGQSPIHRHLPDPGRDA